MNSFTGRRKSGFSLIELIVVVSIIVMISAFVVPNLPSVLQGSQLTQTSQMVTGQVALARQQALARNHSVEVRFIKFADPEQPGETISDPKTGRFRAIQVMDIREDGVAVPIGKVERLPETVILSEELFSTLIQKGDNTEIDGTKPAPLYNGKDIPSNPEMPRGVGKNYQYTAFRFLPDGSTNLAPGGSWYLTMLQANDVVKVKDKKDIGKVNFYTLQVDPVSGSTRAFRPQAG